MKFTKRLIATAAAVLFTVAVPFSTFAATANQYSVTIRGGSMGTVSGLTAVTGANAVQATVTGNSVDLSGLKIASQPGRVPTAIYCANLDALSQNGTVAITTDNNGEVTNGTISNITSDQMYVVVYDYEENVASYTVKYVDQAGNQIAAPEVARGALGTVVKRSPISIANYTADSAAEQSVTLAANQNNVITFTYTQNTTSVFNTVTTEETTENPIYVGATTAAGGATGGAAAGTTIPENETPLAGGNEANSSASSSTSGGASSSETIEDNKTPLAAQPNSGVNMLYVAAGVLAAVAAAVIVAVVIVARKKHNQSGEQ